MTAAISYSTKPSQFLPKARAKMSGKGKMDHEQNSKINDKARETGNNLNGIHSETAMEAESDVDELIDSDTEKADATSIAAKPARGKGKNNIGGGANTGNRKATASNSKAAESIQDKDVPRTAMKGNGESNGLKSKIVPTQKDQIKSIPTKNSKSDDASATSREAASSSSDFDRIPNSSSSSTSREMSGRTATGGPVPYYYSAPSNTRSNISPASASVKKSLQSISGGSGNATSKSDTASSDGEDLTPLEVDKFLDLIEKHNLDTRNEDDMARSVTELYQEWLEWCAKRNVQSTKSKQALVSEFVRIHQGFYGTARQQRAMGIVQGSRSIENPGMNHPMFGAGFDFVEGRGSGNKNKGNAAHSDGDLIRQRSNQSLRAQENVIASSNSGPTRRSLTPVQQGGYEEPQYAPNGIPPAVLENMHLQIREEVWKELSMTLRQSIHEATADLKAENVELVNRIHQLETHSDNLAQWIQHLNTVQEDIIQSIRSNGVPPPPPPSQTQSDFHPGQARGPPRGGGEEIVHEQSSLPVGYRSYPDSGPVNRNGIVAEPPMGRPYNGPAAGYGVNEAAHSPANRMYPLRQSPSPSNMSNKPIARAKGRVMHHEMYDRPTGSHAATAAHPDGMNHPSGVPPPPPSHHHHPHPHPHSHPPQQSRGHPQQYYDEPMRGGPPMPAGPPHSMQGEIMQGGGYPSGPPRSYYPGPPPIDDRAHYSSHPNSPSSSMMKDMRSNKRVRNGY